MNASKFDLVPRVFLPRWLPTSQQDELSTNVSAGAADDVLPDTFSEHLRDWERERSLSSAEALVAYAISTNRPIESAILRAASFIIDRAPHTLSARHAQEFLGKRAAPDADSSVMRKLARARRIARRYPDSSLIWSDLAYYHCLLGSVEAARVAATTADHVATGAPSEVLPVVRCMVHLDEPDFALRSLRRSLKELEYPDVIIAELAVCQILEASPKYFRQATRLVGSKDLTPTNEARVRAAVATELLNSGSDRQAKKILSNVTLRPDENTLAQLVWLSGHLGLEIDPTSSGVKKAHEAIGRAAYQDRDYAACITAIELWSEYQPFSITAISFGSYVAGFLTADHERSLKLLEKGQIVGSKSFTIWNNSAFDYAKLDRLEDATRALHLAHRFVETDEERDVYTATRGLILIRNGDIEEGENLYRKSIKGFMSRNDLRSASIASLMCAEETARTGRAEAISLLEDANRLATEGNHPRVIDAIHLVRRKVTKGLLKE